MQTIVRYSFPTTIHAGAGARRLLPKILQDAGVKRPLIVTDRDLAKLPMIGELQSMLTQAGLDVRIFSEIFGNPVKSQVNAGVCAYKEHRRDSIVAIGGGAALDVAKVIGLLATNPGDLFDYEDGKPNALPVNHALPCLVALPTTAGTGSEVGRSSVVSDDRTHAKKIIFDAKLLAHAVLADPELTVGLPAGITAATGMDALTHCLESYLAKGSHPMCDGIALEGMRLVQRSLKDCVTFAKNKEGATPQHVQARDTMLNAALMGAVAFQKGLGVTHSLAHALSTVCDTHHGLANGILLPFTMRFNKDVCAPRFDTIAATLRLGGAADVIAWIIDLRRAIGIPANLGAAGVTAQHIPDLVEVALQDGCHALNPRPVSRADFKALFEEAIAA